MKRNARRPVAGEGRAGRSSVWPRSGAASSAGSAKTEGLSATVERQVEDSLATVVAIPSSASWARYIDSRLRQFSLR